MNLKVTLTSLTTFLNKVTKLLIPLVVVSLLLGIILGTFLATFLASHLSSLYLGVFFALFMAFVSSQMFLNKKPKPSRELSGNMGLFAAGSVIGAISALV